MVTKSELGCNFHETTLHHHNHEEAAISKVEDNSEKYKPQYGPTKQKIKLMQGFIFVPRIYACFYSN